MRDITLETDGEGIWLIEMTPEGPYQLGHVSWREVLDGIQKEIGLTYLDKTHVKAENSYSILRKR